MLLDILHHIAPTKLHLASQPPHVRPYSTVQYIRPTLYSQFIHRYVWNTKSCSHFISHFTCGSISHFRTFELRTL